MLFEAMRAATTKDRVTFQTNGETAGFAFPWQEAKQITVRTRIGIQTPEETIKDEIFMKASASNSIFFDYSKRCQIDPANPKQGMICVMGSFFSPEDGQQLFVYSQFGEDCSFDLYCFNRIAFSYDDPITEKAAVPRLQMEGRFGKINRIAMDQDQIFLVSQNGNVVWKFVQGFEKLKSSIGDRWSRGASDFTKDAEWSEACRAISCNEVKLPQGLERSKRL